MKRQISRKFERRGRRERERERSGFGRSWNDSFKVLVIDLQLIIATPMNIKLSLEQSVGERQEGYLGRCINDISGEEMTTYSVAFPIRTRDMDMTRAVREIRRLEINSAH